MKSDEFTKELISELEEKVAKQKKKAKPPKKSLRMNEDAIAKLKDFLSNKSPTPFFRRVSVKSKGRHSRHPEERFFNQSASQAFETARKKMSDLIGRNFTYFSGRQSKERAGSIGASDLAAQGIYWNDDVKQWEVNREINGVRIYGGTFETEKEAVSRSKELLRQYSNIPLPKNPFRSLSNPPQISAILPSLEPDTPLPPSIKKFKSEKQHIYVNASQFQDHNPL